MRAIHKRQHQRGLVGSLAIVAAIASGCATHGLSFVTDDRIDIVAPHDRSEVALPFTVEWTARDVAIGPDAGRFGVFIDRAPPPPGQTAAWLFRGETGCKGRGRDRCATAEFLADRQVFETTDTALTITNIQDLTGNDSRRQFHEVTVVLLDATGARVQESAWSVQVEVTDR